MFSRAFHGVEVRLSRQTEVFGNDRLFGVLRMDASALSGRMVVVGLFGWVLEVER